MEEWHWRDGGFPRDSIAVEKYIDHIHTVDGKPAKIPEALGKIILENFESLMKLKERGINLFFTDIDKIKEQMLDELK